MQNKNIIPEAIELIISGKRTKGLDLVYDTVEELLLVEDFGAIRQILKTAVKNINQTVIPISFFLCILTATLPWRNELKKERKQLAIAMCKVYGAEINEKLQKQEWFMDLVEAVGDPGTTVLAVPYDDDYRFKLIKNHVVSQVKDSCDIELAVILFFIKKQKYGCLLVTNEYTDNNAKIEWIEWGVSVNIGSRGFPPLITGMTGIKNYKRNKNNLKKLIGSDIKIIEEISRKA